MIQLSKFRMCQLFAVACMLCVSLALATQSAAAEKGKWRDGDETCDSHYYGRHHQVWPLLMKLGLDADQEKEIRAIRSSMLKNMIRKKADLKIARLELREMLHNDPVDMAAVESHVNKMEHLRASVILDGIRARQEIRSRLTPNQRKELKELIMDSRQQKAGRHNRKRT
jgi:Spy/CpxP family protein refolding chaperone